MSAVDLAAVIVAVVCLATVVVLTVAVVSLVRTMRELRDVVDDLRDSALPMVDDLRTTVTKADAELHRVDRVIGRAERIAATADHASRLTYRAFAPPLIKGLSLVSGAGQAGRRLRERRRHRRSLDLAANDSAAAAREISTTVEAAGDSSAPAREISTTAEAAASSRPAATRPSPSGNTGRSRTRRRRR